MNEAKYITWEDAVLWLRQQDQYRDLVRDCYYGDPLDQECQRYHSSPEWIAVRELLGKPVTGARALDLGAGRGIVAYALHMDGWETTALEPDSSAIVGGQAIQKMGIHGLKVIQGFGENLPFPDGTFDVVIARAVLHHSQNLEKLCAESARVLKKRGKIIAMREHVISKPDELQLFLTKHPLHKLYGGENAFTLKEYKNAFRRAELSILQELGPCCSDINLHPHTRKEHAQKRRKKFGYLLPTLIADRVNIIRGKFSNEPGRLYSFVLTK
jgi:SAM-dependent methyltransferase